MEDTKQDIDFVSDEICELVNQIKHAKILAAGSSYNCDLLTAYRCLSKKFPNAVYKPSIEINRTFCEMPADTDSYDLEKLRIGIRKLVIGAKMNDGFCLHALKNFLFAKMNPQDNFFHNTKAGICISCNRMVSVTMNGNVSFCYNTYDKLGTIETDTMESIRQKAQAVWDSIYDPACSSCEARDICYWGCARLLKDKNNHAYNCENFRKPFFRILREEVMALNNPLTKEETDWFNQQELLIEQEVKTFLQCGKNHNKGK